MKYLGFLIYTIIIFLSGYYCSMLKSGKIITRPILSDTNIIKRWESEIKRDTNITFTDKITTKEIKPEIIKKQDIDSLFINKTQKLNVMLDIKKSNDTLKIITANASGKNVKEFCFLSNLNEFRLISRGNDVFYSENRNLISFPKMYIGYEFRYDCKYQNFKHILGSGIGIDLFNKIDIYFTINSFYETGLKVVYKLK